MSSNRYYFSNFIEDDTLSVLAVSAKEMLQQVDTIVQMYQNNNEILYGQSPKQMLFLMKQNNKPLYSLSASPSSVKNSCVDASNPGPSTPISRNSDFSISRRVLVPNSPLDDTEGIRSISRTMETSVIHQTGKIDEQFVNPLSSTSSPDIRSTDSPHSVEITLMSESFKMDDPEEKSSVKVNSGKDADDKESPRSSELVRMTGSLTVDEKDNSSVLTRPENEVSKQVSSRSVGVIRHTSNLELDEKASRNRATKEHKMNTNLNPGTKSGKAQSIDSIKKDFMNQVEETFKIPRPLEVRNESSSPVKSVKNVILLEERMSTNTDFPEADEKSGKPDKADFSSKDLINHAKGVGKITNQVKDGNETPSPVKKSKIYGVSTVDIQDISNSSEKAKLSDISPKVTEILTGPIQDDTINVMLNEESPRMVVEARKRKSPSPNLSKATIFSTMPRVIQWAGEAQIDIEMPCDSEDNSSPINSRISSAANSSLNESPVLGGSKTDESPQAVKIFSSPPESVICIDLSCNVSRVSRLGSEEDKVYGDNYALGSSSNIETSTADQSSNSDSSDKYNTEYFVFKHTVMKFNTLYSLRQEVMQKIFTSLLKFQNNVDFLNSYAIKLGFFVNAISSPDKWYFTKELKEIVNEATVMVTNLMKKLSLWKKDIDMDVNTWQKCVEQIQQLKTQYGPFISNDDKQLMTIETLQVYEYELKAIWKRMDEIIMMGDARRTLFSQTAHDFENLIKIFVQCLIMVGVLYHR